VRRHSNLCPTTRVSFKHVRPHSDGIIWERGRDWTHSLSLLHDAEKAPTRTPQPYALLPEEDLPSMKSKLNSEWSQLPQLLRSPRPWRWWQPPRWEANWLDWIQVDSSVLTPLTWCSRVMPISREKLPLLISKMPLNFWYLLVPIKVFVVVLTQTSSEKLRTTSRVRTDQR